jgi:hypothetical protein
MDWSSKKCAWTASAALVVTLIVMWGVMSLGYAYNSSLERMNDSFSRALTIASLLDETISDLDHLSLNQQASLSTGNERFHDGVWESALALENNLGWLDDAGAKAGLPRAELVGLRAAVDQALKMMAKSYDVRDARGKTAALAFYDTNDTAICAAKAQASEVRTEVLRGISDGIRGARGTNGFIEVLFHGAPRGIAFPHGSAKAVR